MQLINFGSKTKSGIGFWAESSLKLEQWNCQAVLIQYSIRASALTPILYPCTVQTKARRQWGVGGGLHIARATWTWIFTLVVPPPPLRGGSGYLDPPSLERRPSHFRVKRVDPGVEPVILFSPPSDERGSFCGKKNHLGVKRSSSRGGTANFGVKKATSEWGHLLPNSGEKGSKKKNNQDRNTRFRNYNPSRNFTLSYPDQSPDFRTIKYTTEVRHHFGMHLTLKGASNVFSSFTP